MDLLKHTAAEGGPPDVSRLLALIPFCRHLGIAAEHRDGALVFVMPFAPHLVGNPILPALHGGVIGAFLETASIAQVIWELGGAHLPKPIDVTIDYLRSAKALESHARARIAKRGRRVVNVQAELWQDDLGKPIALLRGHFLVGAS